MHTRLSSRGVVFFTFGGKAMLVMTAVVASGFGVRSLAHQFSGSSPSETVVVTPPPTSVVAPAIAQPRPEPVYVNTFTTTPPAPVIEKVPEPVVVARPVVQDPVPVSPPVRDPVYTMPAPVTRVEPPPYVPPQRTSSAGVAHAGTSQAGTAHAGVAHVGTASPGGGDARPSNSPSSVREAPAVKPVRSDSKNSDDRQRRAHQ